MFIRALAGAAILAASTVAQSAPLRPTGKWVVHFDDAQCLAERNYGSEKNPLIFALKQPVLGDVMQLDIVEVHPSGPPTQVDGRIQFDNGEPAEVSVLRFAPPKDRHRIHMMNVPIKQFESGRSARTIHVYAQSIDETFELDQIGPLLDLMGQCVDDLAKVWNVTSSANEERNIRQDVKGNLAGLVKGDDYPWQSLLREDTGAAVVALLVNEQGKVADCSVIHTSGVAILDAQTCVVLKNRATFVPAVGKDGKPAKDAFIQRINWQLVG